MIVAQHCYTDFVGTKALVGEIVVGFLFVKGKDRSGKIKNTTIKRSTLNVKAVHECILNELKDMEISSPPYDNYDMKYTFHFGGSKTMDFSSRKALALHPSC